MKERFAISMVSDTSHGLFVFSFAGGTDVTEAESRELITPEEHSLVSWMSS